ncbi:hypothetical protein F2Q70_00018134 [Brassica cretica]|uniref:Uncharacterized protein n=1 Tax=Brassica cretica TaxID=69181 RepID=A0A8S9I284_BRACR|nr:hypothetical protein F2Q70_00018134 [Brassica cretica]KAF2597419.1 hypothetical protein F2Q68_00011192 [Brassica cretica]
MWKPPPAGREAGQDNVNETAACQSQSSNAGSRCRRESGESMKITHHHPVDSSRPET